MKLRHVKVARIIYTQTQAVSPKYFKKFTLPQSAACVLLCEDELPRIRGAAGRAGADARAGLQHAQSDVSPLPSKPSEQDE